MVFYGFYMKKFKKPHLGWGFSKKPGFLPTLECLNQFNKIQSAQKEKQKFTTSIPFNNYTLLKLKNKAAKLGTYIPIKSNKNIYQRIRVIVTVLTHWRPQELIELVILEREGEQEHTSIKLNAK